MQPRVVYEGGLTKAAKVMKLASIASFVGASAAVPFFFTGDSAVPSAARTILALTTIGMTGSSTGIVTWALRPYITSISVLSTEEITAQTPLLVETMTVLAQPKVRLVFPEQLKPATQPLSSWVVDEISQELNDKAAKVLEEVNKGRKRLVTVAKPGDLFYAHMEGGLGSEMEQIIAVAGPSQA
ncbi:hypothetical protein GGF49_002526 [Coemansia sp. RSA 1853]|nr:hypothetical protein LPJ76_001276 [Coemansia sp. RSA 638]KAJ2542893.1 hypothetical protein GGF49_002526 [Coemansia sp. RSA 1853]